MLVLGLTITQYQLNLRIIMLGRGRGREGGGREGGGDGEPGTLFRRTGEWPPTSASLSKESNITPSPFHVSTLPNTGPSDPASSVNQMACE